MGLSVFRMFLVFLMFLSLEFGEMSPGKRRDKRRNSIFDDSIFKNRAERCLKPIGKNPELEEMMTDSEGEVMEEVNLNDSEEDLSKDTKEPVQRLIIREDTLMRRFIRCMIGKRTEHIQTISYRRREGEYQSVEQPVDREERVELKEMKPIEGRIKKEESNLTGIKTEIGTTRLPENLQRFVDVHEELAVPGTSKEIVRLFPSIKAMEQASERRRNVMRRIMDEGEKESKREEGEKETKPDESQREVNDGVTECKTR